MQEVASAYKDTIPPEFVRSECEQPAITTFQGPVPEVPTVDLGEEEKVVVGAVAEASREWGMFQVVNHGIPEEVIGKLQRVGKEFFELPREEKEVYAKPAGSKSVEGYGTALQKEVEGKKGWVDHLFHNIWPPPLINYQFWPKNPPYRYTNDPRCFQLFLFPDFDISFFFYFINIQTNSCNCKSFSVFSTLLSIFVFKTIRFVFIR